ncbi:MAG: KH domain-containing protein [Leptolyngbya sp. SIO4C1]|nr:KH domain-containing protein [Leptolyngbya sp. SIO4C1]
MKVPDFEALVRYLVEPFLDTPEALRLDCERLSGGKRLWIRVAFDGEDKGRVFGRGGRNIQAIRKVVRATAKLSDCSVNLDVYGESAHEGNGSGGRSRGGPTRARHRSSQDRPRRRSS